ncbi:MAG: hypothetical protein ABSD99_01300 [Candidatus Bathyarchaeia archaeon]
MRGLRWISSALFSGSAPSRLQLKRWYRNPRLRVILKVDADELANRPLADKLTEPQPLLNPARRELTLNAGAGDFSSYTKNRIEVRLSFVGVYIGLWRESGW